MEVELSFNHSLNYLGDHAVVLSFDVEMNDSSLNYVNKIATALNIFKNKYTWIKDIIPAYQTITIVYDIYDYYLTEKVEPVLLFKKIIPPLIAEASANFTLNTITEVISVPVCYDIEFGIDLKKLARTKNISIEALIQLHCNTIYTVYCLGFMPGFAYMGKVPEKIQTARHAKPRMKVYAGSIGIAGLQTGIYPTDSPGGWQIIGRTPLKIFDPHPSKLALFKTGDRIQFYSINIEEFNIELAKQTTPIN